RIQPIEIYRTQERFRGMQPIGNGMALVEDFNRVTRIIRTQQIALDAGIEACVVFSRNERDEYHNPGTPVFKVAADGYRVVVQTGDAILMSGMGASASGDHPFLDRLNLTTGKAERLFQSRSDVYESVVAVLNDSGTRLLTRRESPTEPPNYYIHDG